MIDADENIRYSRGRDRRVAMRHRDEATVQFSMAEGQQTKEEQRNRERIKWADDQYARDRQHFETSYQMEKRNFQLTEENYKKEGEFIQQQRQLEDNERTFRRSIQDQQYAADVQHMNITQSIKKSMDDLTAATTLWAQQVSEAKANMNYQATTGSINNYVPTATQAPAPPLQNTATVSYNWQTSYGTGTITQTARQQLATPGGHGGVMADVGGYIPGFDGGGYTGLGPKHQAAGVVHAGEWVVPQHGSLVSSNPEMLGLLKKIHEELTGIHKDGGNAVIHINQASPTKAMNSAKSLYQKVWAS
jgi:hypothetical protein